MTRAYLTVRTLVALARCAVHGRGAEALRLIVAVAEQDADTPPPSRVSWSSAQRVPVNMKAARIGGVLLCVAAVLVMAAAYWRW